MNAELDASWKEKVAFFGMKVFSEDDGEFFWHKPNGKQVHAKHCFKDHIAFKFRPIPIDSIKLKPNQVLF